MFKNRISCVLLTVLIIVANWTPFTFAKTVETPVVISAETVEAYPGSEVAVDVSISGNPGIIGAKIGLSYDAKLTLNSAKNGVAWNKLTMTEPAKYVHSGCSFVWDASEIATEDIKDGIILTLNFTVSSQAQTGDVLDIDLSAGPNDFCDNNVETVNVQLIKGSIKVINDHSKHHWNEGTVTKDATCTASGKIHYECTYPGCGETMDKVIPALGHNIKKVTAVAATCQATGLKAHYRCDNCGQLYTDAKGKKKTTLAKVTVAKKSHAYTEQLTDDAHLCSKATCTSGARYYYDCATCDRIGTKTFVDKKQPALGHDYTNENYSVTKKATLTKDGAVNKVCDRCGAKTKVTTYKANKISLSKASFAYTGDELKPEVIVKDSKKKEIDPSNYDIEWPEALVTPGKKTVKVVMKNWYSGTKTLTYTVALPKPVISTITTSSKSLTAGWKAVEGKIDGFEIRYSTSSKMKKFETVLVENSEALSYRLTELAGSKTYYIQIRSYVQKGDKTFYSELSAKKSKKTKA